MQVDWSGQLGVGPSDTPGYLRLHTRRIRESASPTGYAQITPSFV